MKTTVVTPIPPVQMATSPGAMGAAPIPAARWRRLLARCFDVAAVLFILWALVVLQVLWFVDGASQRVQPGPWGRSFVVTACFVVLHLLYEVFFVALNQGQTPGKELCRIGVACDGPQVAVPVGFGRAAWRAVLPAAAWLLTPLWWAAVALLLTGATAGSSGRRRAVHDVLAGTVVVVRPKHSEVDDVEVEMEEEEDHGDGA